MKIADRIYLVGSGSNGLMLTDEWDCNCYLVAAGDELILFDCGCGIDIQLLEQEIIRDGFRPADISYLCLTHCHGDHIGAAGYLQKKYGLKVVVMKSEAAILRDADEEQSGLRKAREAGYYPTDYHLQPCVPDILIEAGERLQIGDLTFEIRGMKGHSPCGTAYYTVINDKSVLVIGDMLTAAGKVSIQLIPGADVLGYVDSIDQLKELEIDILLPGHGCFLLRNGSRAVTMALASFDRLVVPV